MALQCHFDLVQEWEQGYQESLSDVECVVRYLQSLSQAKSQPTPWLKALSGEFQTEALEACLARGCLNKTGLNGWIDAQRTQEAFVRLKAFHSRCRQSLDEMQSLVEVASSRLQSREGTVSRPTDVDALFLAASQIDALHKEHALHGSILDKLSVLASTTELATYLTVWKLRPYVADGLTAQGAVSKAGRQNASVEDTMRTTYGRYAEAS